MQKQWYNEGKQDWHTSGLQRILSDEKGGMKHEMVQKLIAITLAAVLALAMLTACGGTPSVPEETEATQQVVDNINAVRTKMAYRH